MTYGRSLARTGGFALAYLLAVLAGRLTVLDGRNMSLVWPAAGVAAVWFCAQRRSRARWADVAALAVITMVVNTATGATPAMAAIFVAANLAQVWTFLRLLDTWRPRLWDDGLHRSRDLWALLGAAFGATVAGAAVGPTGMWLITGHYSWPSTFVWLARNTAGVLLIGAVALCAGQIAAWFRQGRPLRRHRAAECIALIVCSATVYLGTFAYSRGLPIAFTLLAATIWAGARFPTPFVVVHDLAVGTVSVLFTLSGHGPFAAIDDATTRAFVGQLFVVMVAVVGLTLALGRNERDSLLTELAAEKAQLAREREQASQRADLLQTIIDSTFDGLLLLDPDRRVLLRNPAATQLLGEFTGLDGLLRNTDGTPFVLDLTGADLPETDVLVSGTGRVLSLRAAELPDPDGARSSVVLFHDVTAERRRRDELTGFAGVVAHDLLSPLTAITGWAEVAAAAVDMTPAHPAVDRARDGLARVSRSAERMRSLIDGLLDYTTARDGEVATETVDLGAMVAEVTVARLDAAIAGGLPPPRFTVGGLPRVRADPVLMRQLLDNLIGNAIKYTAPGVTPSLTITATNVDRMAHVCVADNGIGIPAGQHDQIFGNFHRAHATQGYAGTGLGLGICKRIVERHGGTITAADNPGGGSRFLFTVPLDARDHEPARDSAQLH
ncbi:ATP-binding protein [Actinoplanes utahensis]|uniref:ATP-binding protein n=1 Tax=Actinoplanes utahensis TaxID=1869 RepID=UPI00068CB781|nr:ATP-binding protein [Actinoplanes utahensis]GIF30347.1 hypothetical protein Aut01nite_33330 [Actinoplanes utahensis]